MAAPISYKRILLRASIGSAVLGFALMFSYVLFGRALVEAIYESNLSFVNQLLEGKAITPLEVYFAEIDKAVVIVGVYFLLAGALLLALVTNPLGLIFSGASFFLGTLIIFLVLDLFPALVKPLHFDMIPYYNYRLTYIPDPVLGFRERAYHEAQITNFRGFAYSPLYGIDVPPQTLHWSTDEEGFRNPQDTSSTDVVVIGSSFAEYGMDLDDTYPMRLEKKLGGQKVVNLAKAGYGPFQYLEVLEQYGIRKKPKYVLLAFYAPGDVDIHLADWVKGRKSYSLAKRSIAFGGLFPRYRIALEQTWQMLSSAGGTVLQLGVQRIVGTGSVHPDVAVLRLPNNVTERIFFTDGHSARSTENLLRSPEWHALEKILVEFKNVSEQNQIVPVLVYIPAATEIYAEYSTGESGANWRRSRDSYVASSGSNEEAGRRLAGKLGIEVISLLPAYKAAARQGKLLYYPLDSHWNSAGREIAAQVTARALKAHAQALQSTGKRPKAPEKTRKDNPGAQHASFDSNASSFVRTIDGKINSWSRGAEQLYGWRKEEAIGQISHKLLKTQFPEPLQQIDAQLVQTGQWEGKLVHATRDGRRVVVESQWNLKKGSSAVVEINNPSADS